ncbi:hypothetical protein MXB_1828 [Myxobolus squamalis]|nr:hypothetical protein MXB_1828 [Myxobolus squamalis]
MLSYINRSEVKLKLEHDRHLLVFDRFSADLSIKFWRCELKNECKVRIHTQKDDSHVVNHGSNVAKFEVDKIRMTFRNRAVENTEIPSMLLNHAIQDASVAIQGKLLTKDIVRKMVQRVRNQTRAAPSQPADRQSFVVPEAYTT